MHPAVLWRGQSRASNVLVVLASFDRGSRFRGLGFSPAAGEKAARLIKNETSTLLSFSKKRISNVEVWNSIDFIIIPCVSAHFFVDDIQQQANLPVLSIFDAVAETIARDYSEVKTVGLLGTTGTVKGGLFQKRLAQEKINTRVPDEAMQSKIMDAIYDIKTAAPARTRSEIATDLVRAAESLIANKPDGARAIIAGCTEIPLALGQQHLSVPYFDSLTILARAAILRAGVTPVV